MPAPGPGAQLRPRAEPIPGAEASLPQAHPALRTGATRPGALRALLALRAVLPGGLGRQGDRAARPRLGVADQPGARRAVRLLLLRQHDPDLPGRRADFQAVPLPLPALGPAVDGDDLLVLRRRVPPVGGTAR